MDPRLKCAVMAFGVFPNMFLREGSLIPEMINFAWRLVLVF
jgi:hypothetical protein